MSTYDAWKLILQRQHVLRLNDDGLFPDGVRVWTPHPGLDPEDWEDYPGDIPSGYVYPDWPWIQGRILAQVGWNDWYVFIDYFEDWPFLCLRHSAALRRVASNNGVS